MGTRSIMIPAFYLYFAIIGLSPVLAQVSPFTTDFISLLDSLDNRIAVLQEKLPALKQKRDASYYNVKRDLDLTLFARTYEEYVMEEEMDKAKDLVESRLADASTRKDQYSIDFYGRYKDKIYMQIKQQRMFYQDLLSKEKKFRKAYEDMTGPGTLESHMRASRMVQFALKYARENNFQEAAKYLENCLLYNEAVIFDFHSSYDLVRLTSRPKFFEEAFAPLIASDSISHVQQAEDLLKNCMNFSRLTNTGLDSAFYAQQSLIIATSLSDLLNRAGRERELEKYTDQAVRARLDTLNPEGVFKWNDFVVVIDEFIPASSFENVKKGEAIIHADNMLAAYLSKNELCKSARDLKFGHVFIIPYVSNVRNTSFYFDPETGKWQYIACYTSINNDSYTRDVSRYMPPIYFDDLVTETAQNH